MRHVILPQPPNANDPAFKDSPLAFNRAASDWMRRVKGLIEDASRIDDAPLGQQFRVGSFTTNTTIAGTSTGTDVSNFLCSLLTAFIAKGQVSQTVTRSDA